MEFEKVFNINVSDKTEKKNGLTYLSWAWAWAEFKKVYPQARYKINTFDGTYCTGNEKIGYMVSTSVTVDDLTYDMWLPIMDFKNAAVLNPNMTQVNKSIMRCLTKNLAMFGLGLYVYAGEDLPEADEVEQPQPTQGHNVAQKGVQTPKTERKVEVQGRIQEEEKTAKNKPLTRSELVQVWGIKNVEETVVWFEGKFGKELSKFDIVDTEKARIILQQRKDKKEQEERKAKEALERIDGDLPFNV